MGRAKRGLLVFLFFLLWAAVACRAPGSTRPAADDVEAWEQQLGSSSSSTAEREAALASLQELASGPAGSSQTRAANLALTRHWLDRKDPLAPRELRSLIQSQIAAGDPLGAHLSFRKLLEGSLADEDAALVAQAAANAAAVGDMAKALEWALAIDEPSLAEPSRSWVHLARLKAGQAVGRCDLALESARQLARRSPETLHLDPRALLASARTHQDLGLLEEAIADYEVLVNVHPRDTERPEALLALSRLQARAGKLAQAGRTLAWVIEAHPQTPAALQARLDLLEADGRPADPSKLAGYLAVLRQSTDMASARRACERFTARFLAAGLPLEVMTVLADLAAEEDPDALAPLVAQECLGQALGPILDLLASRADDLAVAAAATLADARGLRPPDRALDSVADAMRRLGLAPVRRNPLEQAIEEARRLARAGDWKGAGARIEQALQVNLDLRTASRVEAVALLAEAEWRQGRIEAALTRLRGLSGLAGARARARELSLLEADILFSSGQQAQACEGYRRTASLGASRWVDLQLARCASFARAGGRGSTG